MKLGDSYVLISAIVYKKTQIPHYDNLIECNTKKYECIVETYQGVFEKFGNYHIEYKINNIKYCTSVQKERSVCDWWEQGIMKVNLPENKSILPMMYISIYEDGKVIEATEYGSYASVLETFE